MKCIICSNDKLDTLATKLRYGGGHVHYCPQCDYGMLEAGFKDVAEYYDKEYRKKFKDELADEKEESPEEIYRMRCRYQEDRLNIIKDFFDIEKSFLEIGCSAGQFISKIKDKFGYVAGIELSKKCAEHVEKNWEIPVYTEEISEIAWNGRQFDYIGFFQVLEHVENPKRFLYDVYNRLQSGGRVFIEIPSLNDPLRKLWKASAYEQFYYHEAHLSYFSEKSIRFILTECGYKVEAVYHMQDYNFLNHLYWYFNNGPQPSCAFGLDEPKIDFQDDGEETRGAGEEINKLLLDMNRRYFEILSKYKLTSNMFVIASKS